MSQSRIGRSEKGGWSKEVRDRSGEGGVRRWREVGVRRKE